MEGRKRNDLGRKCGQSPAITTFCQSVCSQRCFLSHRNLMAFPLSSFQTSTILSSPSPPTLPAEILCLRFLPSLFCSSSCWPGEQLTKSKDGAPALSPSSATASSNSPLPPLHSSLVWPPALASLSAAPTQSWPKPLSLSSSSS